MKASFLSGIEQLGKEIELVEKNIEFNKIIRKEYS